jgi:signal transduction histidine kinase/DNA-binding response OmpR family regulator
MLVLNAKYFSKICLIAVCYFVTGQIGLLFTTSSQYSVFIWPPVGVALACLTVWGKRYWPGVLIGALLLNLLHFFNPSNMIVSIFVPIVVSLSACLQVVMGADVIRRHIGFANPLTNPGDIIKFGILAGPMTCVIRPLWTTLALVSTGLVQWVDLPLTASLLWFSDTMGVLIFAPIVLAFLIRVHEVWRKRILVFVLPMVLGFMVLVLLFYLTTNLNWPKMLIHTDARGGVSAYNNTLSQSQEIIVSGIMIVGLMGLNFLMIFLLMLTGRKYDIQNLIDQKTQSLEEKKNKAESVTQKALADAKAQSLSLANVAHEIRTSMHGILGFSDLLKSTDLNERQQYYVDSLGSNGEQLLKMVNDILDVSRIEKESLSLENVDFDIEYLIADVFQATLPALNEKPVEVFMDIEEGMPTYVNGDPTRLRQVLINLLNNAMKFTAKGEIGVVVSQLKDESNDQEIALQFIVKDSGFGIPLDKQQVIFESFTQVDESVSAAYGGTGLGLNICRSLVEKMGGTIRVISQQGSGSRFIFWLPFKRVANKQKELVKPLSMDKLKGHKVLIVDSNKTSCEILYRYCEQMGMDVLFAAQSIPSALNRLDAMLQKDECPDIILSEVHFPDDSDQTLTQRISSNPKCRNIKIVAISSKISVGSAVEAQQKGFAAFLAKPVLKNDLQNVLSCVLGDLREEGQIITRHMAEELSCQGIRILVVEDSLSNLQLIRAYCEALGCDGDFAVNGKEALVKMKLNQYDLCLMDMRMPILDGLQTTRIIRRDLNAQLPIIALTAEARKEDHQQCLEAGMNDCMIKPITVEALKDKILYYARQKK